VPPVIEYEHAFDFAVTPAELWATIEDVEEFERWWPWLRDFSIDGGVLKTGAVMHGAVVPPLPYRMRVDVELIRCRRPGLIDALVHGDLEGEAELRFRPGDGGMGTRVEVAWRVEMMQRPMRIASRLAHPLLVKAHDVVVEVTVRGFRRELARMAALPP
jgi:carbon monoxide dehydrogenase subunit G